MLEKIAAGMLGSAVSGLIGGFMGGTKKAGEVDAAGFTSLLNGSKEKSEAEKLGINESDSVSAGTQDALSLLREMTSGGLDGYWKYMMKQLREKTMEEMGVSEASLAAMDPEQRNAIEDKIAEKVKEKLAEVTGISTDDAGKIMEAVNKVNGIDGTEAFRRIEAAKAYKDRPEIV